MTEAGIELRGLGVGAGTFRLDPVDLTVSAGTYAVLMGRTGCGKSTLLETICGLRSAAGGRILLDGIDVTERPPPQRGVGYVPQDGALFPSMSVREHLDFPLRIRKWGAGARAARVGALADWLGLSALLARRPRGLSGGERQRVALGRALSFAPRVVLLDEPLSALDESTREEMHAVLERVRERTDATVLHVTHASDEAQRLGQRVYELDADGIHERPLP